MGERNSYKALISTTEIVFNVGSLITVPSQLLVEYKMNLHWNPYSFLRGLGLVL